jgi:hypothetical protein
MTMNDPLPQCEKEVVNRLAARLARWGLADVALFALDGLRPLSLLAGQLLWVAQPALGLLMDARRVGALANVFEQPEGVAALERELEAVRAPARPEE